MEQTGLELVRPRARIEFSRPQGYRELLEIVKAHGFDLTQQADSRLEPPEVAARWYDDVYRPAVARACMTSAGGRLTAMPAATGLFEARVTVSDMPRSVALQYPAAVRGATIRAIEGIGGATRL